MENPATWQDAEKVIWDAYCDYMDGREAGIIGTSLPTTITKALYDAGLLEAASTVHGMAQENRVPSAPPS